MGRNETHPATTHDIAEAAGMNQSTVSRALRNDPNVSDKTRAKILAIAEKMGCRPNPFVSAFTAQVDIAGHRSVHRSSSDGSGAAFHL